MAGDPPRHQIAIPRRALEGALRALLRDPRAIAWGRAGLNRSPLFTEMIAIRLEPIAALPASLPSPAVAVALDPESEGTASRCIEMLRSWRKGIPSRAPVGVLALSLAPRRGLATALLTSDGGIAAVDLLKITGAGMRTISIRDARNFNGGSASSERDHERWSRLIGALGAEPWGRLRSLRYCLVGAGRTGSLVATSLARLGASHLTLIDPDRLELHNLDAMDEVTPADLGRSKAVAVRNHLVALGSDAADGIVAISESITTLRALILAKDSDMLISCVDHDGARLATAMVATLYSKPLLDIGTGIFGRGADRRMGADVRLVLPGEWCLFCLGGLANFEHARTIFGVAEETEPKRQAWYEERAGSLRSLNQIAAHLGLRLVEDLVAERLTDSTWLHLEFDSRGAPSIRGINPPRERECELCRHGGEGDEGLSAIRDVAAWTPARARRRNVSA